MSIDQDDNGRTNSTGPTDDTGVGDVDRDTRPAPEPTGDGDGEDESAPTVS